MVRPLDLPAALVEEVAGAVPLLVERTRSQVELAQRIVSHLPCLGRRGDGSSAGAGDDAADDSGADDEHLAPVVDIATAAASPAHAPVPAAEGAPAPDELAIPDYDSLAASQVVPRLASLSVDELSDVEAYEQAHRARQTILNRVRQLQSAADGS
ncbi:hypothetical protein [Dermatobacter hominis]|uniref:hypothetical protein n=1 Tax=Dermatobacter hominis TaxID=2884263 RepID=UPI001D1023F5|nr:hypothetical protein [Dermatobacter hominis]UDY36375.1 hypothetical protein LH044_02295 [Dermatobacter hominis]